MRWSRSGLGLAAVAACCSIAFSGAAPEQQLTVYTAQTSYSLPVLDRGGNPSIAVTRLLSPLGASAPRLKGKEWKVELNKAEARLTEGREKIYRDYSNQDPGGINFSTLFNYYRDSY